jgi:hypothetical protein
MSSALERELAKVASATQQAGQKQNNAQGPAEIAAGTNIGVKGKPPPALRKRDTPTILYEQRQAEKIGVEMLLDRAENGLLELIAKNKRFTEYSNSLFSRKALKVDRETLTSDEIASLNRQIHKFLGELSPFLLSACSLDCLEYLFRKYKVHMYNVHDVLYCCLPYHRTDMFRKIIRLLYVRGTKWNWVEGLQKTDSAFERSLFTKQCIRNPTFLNFILQTTKDSAQEKYASANLTSFLFFVVSEYIAFQTSIGEEMLVKLLSYCVFPGLSSSNKDAQSASLLLTMQLSQKLPFSHSLVGVLFVEICRGRHTDLQSNVLQVLVTLCATQQKSLKEVPLKAVKQLVRFQDLVQNLKAVNKSSHCLHLWRLLLPRLFEFCSHHANYSTVMKKIVREIDFTSHLDFVTKVLIAHIKDSLKDVKSSRTKVLMEKYQYVGDILRILDLKYGEKFDAVLNKCIQLKDFKEIEVDFVEYLGKVFTDSLRQPMEGKAVTLQAAIDGSKPRLRKDALVKLLDLYRKESGGGQKEISREFIQSALLRRLHDEDESICLIAFSQDELLQIPPQEVLGEVKIIVDEFFACGLDTPNRKKKYLKAKFALKFLIKQFFSKHKSEASSAIPVAFGSLLIRPDHRKLGYDALKLTSSSNIGLFKHIKDKKKAAKQYSKSEEKLLSELDKKTGKDVVINRSTVASLSEALCKQSLSEMTSVLPLLISDSNSEHLLLLAIYSALQQKKSGLKEEQREYLISLLWGHIKLNWDRISAPSSSTKAQQGMENEWKNGAPPLEHFTLLWSDKEEAHSKLLQGILFLLLGNLSMTMVDYLDILVSILQLDPMTAFAPYIDLAITNLCNNNGSAEGDVEGKKMRKESILRQLYYNCQDKLDRDSAKRVRARILSMLYHCFSATSSRLTKVTEDQALAKKRHSPHKHMNGNGKSSAANGSDDSLNIDVELCVPWLFSSICEDDETISKLALDVLELLSGILKSGVLKDATMQSLGDFISQSLLKASTGLITGHVTLASTLQAFNCKAKNDIVSFLLDAAVRYPYKEIAVHLVGSLADVGSSTQRISALSELLKKELDKYIDASYGFANDSRIKEEDISLLSNILGGFSIGESDAASVGNQSLQWFDSYIACMHFPSKHEFSWKVRKAAIDSISCELFSMLPDENKTVLVHTLAFLGSKDDCEIVKSVAQEKGQIIEVDSKIIEPFLAALWNECTGLSKEKTTKQKTKRSKKATGREVENKFKWVQDRLNDSKNLGINSTTLAMEILATKTFVNIEGITKTILQTLELLTYLYQAAKGGCDDDEKIEDSTLFSQASSAAKKFLQEDIDVTSQTAYALQLGLEAIYHINNTSTTSTMQKSLRMGILNLALKCIQLVEQRSVHEIAFENLLLVVNKLTKKELESHASTVLASIMDTLQFHIQWNTSNRKFFASILSILKPFLFDDSTKDLLLDEISKTVVELRRSDQQLFFALAQQTWHGEQVLSMLLTKVFQNSSKPDELASLICEQYSGSQCFEAFNVMLTVDESSSQKKDKLMFITESIASNNAQYSTSGKDTKEVTLRTVILQMNKLSRSSGSGAGEGKECLELYHKLLQEMNRVCTPEESIHSLVTLCNMDDDYIIVRALELLTHKVENYQGKLKPEISGIAFQAIFDKLVNYNKDQVKQAALVTLEACLRYLKDNQILQVVQKILLSVSSSSNMQTSGKAVSFIGSSVRSLKTKMIPQLPKVANFVLTVLGEATKMTIAQDSSRGPCVDAIESSLYTVEKLVLGYGGMMGQYLELTFKLCKDMIGNKITALAQGGSKVTDLLICISENVPVRILLPALLGTLNEASNGLLVSTHLVNMLESIVKMMDHAIIQTHHFDIVNYILGALDRRRSHGVEDAEYATLECALVNCLVSLVMKLSESSFRPVFLHLLDWSTKGSASKGDLVDVKVARNISLFHVVVKLTEKIRSIFVPYFKHFVDTCCDWLERSLVPDGITSKKARKSSEEQSVAIWLLKLQVIVALNKCFSYDVVGFTEESTFDELLPVILNSLNEQPSPEVSARVGALAHTLLDLPQDGMEVDGELVNFDALDVLAKETADCLIKMAIAGNSDTVWKRFNNKVLMASRSDKVRVKLVSIEVASKLAEHLKEDYIILVAETVPFIAELLEDKEQSIQIACKTFVQKLESISGEDLDQYL